MIDSWIESFIAIIPDGFGGILGLVAIIAASLVVLGKGADILVDGAVALSSKWGIPKMIVGATIVSLGTTLPEVTVSVMSAIKGLPGLAVGNAVGSIICDTGLILGIAALIKPLPFKKDVINRQSFIQLGSGLLLILSSFVYSIATGTNPFKMGSRIPQWIGFLFIGLLIVYIIFTIKSAKGSTESSEVDNADNSSVFVIILKMVLGIILVILSSKILIPAVKEFAQRIHIPDSVIAATLVAFGTSLPELITAITASKKGHGDLAIGNVIGADILNVLFVVGASAAVTPAGLGVDKNFFLIQFPAMLFVLFIFRGGISFSKGSIKRPVGAILLATYIAVTVVSYILA